MVGLFSLWGKTTPQSGPPETRKVHPLICHMVDVAEVVGAMWDGCLGAGMRRHVCEALGCDEDAACRTLMFWAALHDLGKASPAFQRRHKPAVALLQAQGLTFEREFGGDAGAYHGLLSAWALPALLGERHLSDVLARDLAKGLGGHHGSWPPPNFKQALNRDHYGGAEWDAARAQLVDALFRLYVPAPLQGRLEARPARQAFVTLLSGLVSTADWIGSMECYFEAAPDTSDLAVYAGQSSHNARRAIHELRWDAWQPPHETASFSRLFPAIEQLNGMQQAIVGLAETLDGPSLVLIEAPTGTGKTEAALYLADHWARTLQQRGLYVAMPTTATSNEMHKRVGAMLYARYGEGQVEPLLIHGQARWQDAPAEITIEVEDKSEGAADGVDAMSWFLPRKRSLLAPFGVGTVDQALLSVLLTRHFFVRLFGLAHKTVIFDEVHAYDTYMSTLFARLLGWLRAQNCSVIMLSATLPASTRRAFLSAYGAPGDLDLSAIRYPAVTWACGGRADCQPLPAPPDRTLALGWLAHGIEPLVAALREALAEGGCAAVLCNTVARAQQVYSALREAALAPEDDLTLFHSRFPLAWREGIENKVRERYGKASTPEQRRGVVVATQVIEQSLDLDFDLMISDLAPVDLLLQRAGRLHRHAGRERPVLLSTPRLLLVEPENADALPEWGSDAYVYEPYFLLRTWLALQGRAALALPSQTQELIEAVYGEEEPEAEGSLAQSLARAKERWEQHRREHSQIARTKLVLPPYDEDLFEQRNPDYAEENPDVRQSMRALTRLGDEGLSLVCLHQQAYGLTLEPEGGPVVDIDRRPDAALSRDLARHIVQVTHGGVVASLAYQRPPEAWRRHSLLRHARLAVFTQGECKVEGVPSSYTLRLSRTMGLQIDKEGK
ncbi:MAG: CRISPR-associated helicase Cas3' [Chloroflexi bacterium]|nr:CRISPR-associated helicase Cas3' [Chloroflexota bacterium]